MNDFDTVNMNKAQKTVYYLREYGVHYTMRRAMKKLGFKVDEDSEYMTWVRRQQCSTKELELQSRETFPFMPKVAVYVEGCGEQAADAGFTRSAFKKQSYRAAKIRIALEQMSLDHLLSEEDAEVFVFAAAGIKPRNQYIYDCVKAMNEDVKLLYAGEGKDDTFRPLLVYTDEDRVTPDGKRYVRPYFKPDMSLELLCNFQYVGGMFAVRRELLEQFRGADVEVFGNGWYDLLFYCFEHTEKIAHIPEVLFAKRAADTTRFGRSEDRGQKRYIERHLKRIGVDAVVENSEVPGFFHVKYQIKGNPLLSIIIPNKDHIDILDQCIQSILHNNSYQNFEIIIAENNSTEQETFDYYEKIKKEDNRINIVYWKKEFNYSAINNFAAEFAAGELLLFLNNDTELISADSLTEMISYCYRPGVGAAGAMLYYEDDTIQHGGVVIKIGGFAANALWSLKDRDERYYPYSVTAREFTACTAACLMMKKSVFQKVGGFDEKLVVALNDVDICMKVRKSGELIMFNPYATLHHYESKSRGFENTPEKQERFNREIAYFQSKWEKELEAGDPYYNKNQTLHRADYSMDY